MKPDDRMEQDGEWSAFVSEQILSGREELRLHREEGGP